MKSARLLLLAVALGSTSCGRVAGLEPAPGHALPVKPMMARTTPSVDELLTPATQARPERVDELVKRSRPRAADPFDLPPPSGGAAPSLPAGSDPSTIPTNSMTATPGE
ncbi:MAG: hypothetical protein ACJ8FT_05570 [Sphingomonas sp.]